jgi:hypothetical protein
LKNDLTQSILEFLIPIQENYEFLLNNPKYVEVVRELGKQKADHVATQNIEFIKKAFGL